MFSKKMILEIIKADISIIPGVKKNIKEDDIVISGDKIIIHIQLLNDINVIEVSKQVLEQIRYKLIDKTDDKNFSIDLIIKK